MLPECQARVRQIREFEENLTFDPPVVCPTPCHWTVVVAGAPESIAKAGGRALLPETPIREAVRAKPVDLWKRTAVLVSVDVSNPSIAVFPTVVLRRPECQVPNVSPVGPRQGSRYRRLPGSLCERPPEVARRLPCLGPFGGCSDSPSFGWKLNLRGPRRRPVQGLVPKASSANPRAAPEPRGRSLPRRRRWRREPIPGG